VATTLLLARHGETDWNRERRWQGHADPPLNGAGRAQASALAAGVTDIDAIYTSDLARARQTAEIVAAELGVPVHVDARLREIDVGEWSGLTRVEIAERFPGATRWVNGETREAMSERVVAALLEIAAAHEGGHVLVVTHGGPLGAVWVAGGGLFEDGPRAGNCQVRKIRVEAGRIARID
jgi:2,3-bisphosphoglycerate-dependent phosphoglycerate mutase